MMKKERIKTPKSVCGRDTPSLFNDPALPTLPLFV